MRGLLTVFRKEVLENLRDRRTIFAALVFGPLFGPLLLAATLQLMVDRGATRADAPMTVAVAHAERAPNLVAFLEQHAVTVERVGYDETQSRAAVLDKSHKAVVFVPEDFGARLAAAQPAPLLVYADASDMFNGSYVERLRGLLAHHTQTLAQLRLLARGVDPTSIVPIAVQDIDVATPASRAVVALGLMSFLVIFAMLAGGMYLAIDATAGERERGSLESLLTTPVPRTHLIYGKIAATAVYMLASLVLTVVACAVAVRFVRLEDFGMTANLGPATVLGIIGVVAPLALPGAALLTVVASFTRSYREAQSYLGFAIMLPTLPLAFIGPLGLQPSLSLMAVPTLGQHFLMTQLLRGEGVDTASLALSAGASLALGLLLAWLAGRLYERESILG
ncbi:MAG: ABC transporter permease [Sinobacteraceae bacterium]|nr:ABC transporter permease [Nevskiaceae bacterium]MCP5466751.1 ABC transporter permease [Nevskiaceae bacterium]MCP5470552.1 ABC transporter permease [Nevskiaceae bacterium]